MTSYVKLTIDDNKAVSAEAIRELLLEAGADDCGSVSVDAPGLESEKEIVLKHVPWAKTFVSFVVRMNTESLRSTARSLANNEFHQAGHEVDKISRTATRALESAGFRAVAPPMGFPMEMDNWPERPWVVAHKPVAEAAGMGVMGIHRCVIHPALGSSILLGTLITDAEIKDHAQPLDFNPCFECRLCVAACPTGAIKTDGSFDFASCYTHNYREFMSGFSDWVETIADSGNARQYRKRVADHESVSMWQSLGFGPNYKAAYCIAVCPAGENIIKPYKENKKQFIDDTVRPFRQKEETIYAVKGSDVHDYVARHFPRKKIKTVSSGLRPTTAQGFIDFLPNLFQRGAAENLDATYHFIFTGSESFSATVKITGSNLKTEKGLIGDADLRISADASTWIAFLRGDRNLLTALLTRRIRLKGNPRLLLRFASCFPT